MDLTLRKGERVEFKGRTMSVTATAVTCLPRVRHHLVDLARTGGTTTYGALKTELGLPYAINGLGWLLDLLSVDSARRGEPPLAALVVTAGNGEVGSKFPGDAIAERQEIYRYWS